MQQVYSRNLYSPAKFWELNALWGILLQKYCSKKVMGQSDQLYCVLNLRAPHKMLLLLTVFNDDSSGPPHFQQPCLVCWLYSCTQGSAVPSLLEVAEEELSGWETAGGFLLLHHRKYPGLLCNGAVCQMLCSRWKGYHILNTEKRPLAVLYLPWKRCHSGA